MSNDIQLFNFGESALRVLGTWDEPWFVAKDVCDALGISNARDAISNLDEDEKNTVVISDSIRGRGNPNINVINESGLYSLVFQSRKPEAKAFRRWVTREVLPAIRKTGSYNTSPARPLPPSQDTRALERALVDYMAANESFTGTPMELLLELTRFVPDAHYRAAGWPRNPQVFGCKIDMIAPALLSSGIELTRGKSGGRRIIRIRRQMKQLSR